MRLIDADNLIKKLVDNGWLKMNSIKDSAEMIAVQSIIYDAPTVDPVKHGKWIDRTEQDEDLNVTETCSECLHNDTHSPEIHIPYCWYCGAKMDL